MVPTHFQSDKQLLLLVKLQANLEISSYAHLYGPQKYSSLTFVPIGMEYLIHEKTTRRKTFVEHFKKVYLLGPSYEHCQCWNVRLNKTRASTLSGTVFFKHKYIINPNVTTEAALVAAAANLSDALKHSIPPKRIFRARIIATTETLR